MRLLFVVSIFLLIQTLSAQSYQLSNAIPVKNLVGETQSYPWSGGMNNPQFSDVDLDLDGNKELVVFDRSDYSFTVYQNGGTPNEIDYQLSPKLLSNLDSCQCVEWALFVDYNCDGLEDLFCGRGSGSNFRVYEQVIYDGDSVGFEMRYDPIFAQSNNYSWMYVVRTDIPAILDIDYDGDVDVVSSTNGFNYFVLHRNMAVENLGRCDTLQYFTEFGCWGEFAESNADNTLAVGDSTNCPRGGGGEPQGGNSRHVGSSLLVFDTNADSLMDVLVGDVSYPSMVAAYNHGSVQYAMMDSVETDYPQLDHSIDIELFPAAFYEDINNDGVRDLLVAPNTTIDVMENIYGLIVYENEGLDNEVDFRYAGREFLVKDHIDAGENSAPFFFDYNKDGLMDLLLAGSESNIRGGDTVLQNDLSYLYQNVGSLTEPMFQIVDSNYLNFAQFSPPVREPSLGGGDLDGDGDTDLLLGISQGFIYHLINTAPFGAPAIYSLAPDMFLLDEFGMPIDIGGVAAPELYDLNGDGDLDLFIGTRFGRIVYYENTGDSLHPNFSLITDKFGLIKVSNDYGNTFSGFAHPRFLDYDGDGVVELLIGSERGAIEVFENLHLALTDSLIASQDLVDFGNLANPTAAILDTSHRYTYVSGNPRGGLMLYAWTSPDTVPDTTVHVDPPIGEELQIYPNPADAEFWVEMHPGTTGYQLRLFNLVGQELKRFQVGEKRFRIDVSDLAAGLYVLQVQKGAIRESRKVWVR